MNKALIVGISDYGELNCGTADCSPLPGAAHAAQAWYHLLLARYGLSGNSDTHTLQPPNATKSAVVSELKWLTHNTDAQDRLIFIFAGHGATVNRVNPSIGTVNDEQGLVCYPAPNDTLADALLFGDEALDALGSTTARVLVVLDACYSGGVIDDGALHLKPLTVEPLRLGVKRFKVDRLITFVSRMTSLYDEARPSIVIISAAQELETAHEGEVQGKRRLLFSHHATTELQLNPTITYADLRDATAVALTGIQVPALDGDTSRHLKPFTY